MDRGEGGPVYPNCTRQELGEGILRLAIMTAAMYGVHPEGHEEIAQLKEENRRLIAIVDEFIGAAGAEEENYDAN